jgi:hypothetical protein
MSRRINSTYSKVFIGTIISGNGTDGTLLCSDGRQFVLKGENWKQFLDVYPYNSRIRTFICAEAPNWGLFALPWLARHIGKN